MVDKMNPVNWFEIPANNLERAVAFYEHVLGLKLTVHDIGALRMAWFPGIQGAATGATGSLVQAESYEPSHRGSMVYFSVPDIEAALRRVPEKGGKLLHGKKRIRGNDVEYGFVAHFEDCEGNRVALHSTQ